MNEIEEITLYELVQTIIKGWKGILITTLITLGFSLVIFFTYNTPTYKSESIASIDFMQEFFTDLGQYTVPYSKSEEFILIFKNAEYIEYLSKVNELSYFEVANSISFTAIDADKYKISVSNVNEEILNKLHSSIKKYSKDFIDYILADKFIDQIESTNNIKSKTLEKQLSDKMQILQYLENELSNTKKLINSNVINPEYSTLSSQLVQMKRDIAEIGFEINEIEINKPKIEVYKNNNDTFEKYLQSSQQLFKSNLFVTNSNDTSYSIYRFSSKTLFPVSILLGIIIGVFIIFFKNYWQNNKKLT